jgi:hypothetical protein
MTPSASFDAPSCARQGQAAPHAAGRAAWLSFSAITTALILSILVSAVVHGSSAASSPRPADQAASSSS